MVLWAVPLSVAHAVVLSPVLMLVFGENASMGPREVTSTHGEYYMYHKKIATKRQRQLFIEALGTFCRNKFYTEITP